LTFPIKYAIILKKGVIKMDKEQLFQEELPKWEGFIYSNAQNLLPKLDRIYGLEDVQQILRVALWRAIEHYEEGKSALSTYIIKLLRVECTDLIQKSCRKGAVPPSQLTPLADTDPEDPSTDFSEMDEREFYAAFCENARRVCVPFIEKGQTYHERDILTLLEQEKSAQEIARQMGINHAKVGSFKLKLKIVYCIMKQQPVTSVTRDIKTASLLRQKLYALGVKPF